MTNLKHNDVCPLCGCNQRRELYSESYQSRDMVEFLVRSYLVSEDDLNRRLDGESFTLQQCRKCSLIYQHAVPDDELQLLLYDKWISSEKSYEKYLARINNRAYMARVERGIRTGIELVEKERSKLVALDFGAGWGIASGILKAHAGQTFVGEISPSRVALLTDSGHTCVDVNDIPDASIDYIYTEQVVEHLVDVGRWISLLCRKLVIGGVLRISAPNGVGINTILGKKPWLPAKPKRWSLNPVAPLEHINCFDASVLGNVCDKFGLVELNRPFRLGLTDLIRNTPIRIQVATERGLFRMTGKKLGLDQYFRRIN